MAPVFFFPFVIPVSASNLSSPDSFRRPIYPHALKFEPVEPWVPAMNAGMTVGVVIHVSMSIGQSFAGGENGYAVSVAGEKRRVAWTQTLAEMPVVWSGGWRKPCAHAFAAVFASGKILQSPGSHGV